MSSDTRWVARPVAAQAVTVFAFVTPVILGALGGWATGRGLREAGTAVGLSILASVAATWVVVYGTQRVTRRLLPLATLLHLDLPFPGNRPSRFAVALKAGSTRNLKKLIDEDPTSDAADCAVTILAFATALSRHDRTTRGHSERVRALADLLGEELGLEVEDRDRLRWAALLHDVGKLGVDHEVLNKSEPLSDEDWAQLKAHPLEGARLAAPLHAFLGEWVETVEHHHERWDGNGYPHGIAGKGIALGARIVAVVDTYEVMTSNARNYRTQVSSTAAQHELARVAGTQLDPHIVSVFLGINQKELRRAMNVAALALQLPALLRWRTPLRVTSPGGGEELVELGTDPSTSTEGLHRPHPDANLPDVASGHPDAGNRTDANDLGREDGGDAGAARDM